MKRKRTPSPATQRRTSRSPLSPRSTRAAKRTPPNSSEKKPLEETPNDEELNIRRSSRARRLSYQSLHTIGTSPQKDDVVSPRSPLSPRPNTRNTRATPMPKEVRRSRSSSPETEDIDTPFYNHVRFSPSAKPGSPARFSRRRASRAAASIAKMRLQNVPSEDEQSEFNRRYSRDLRSRRQQERSDDKSTYATRRSSQSRRSEPEEKEGDDDEDDDDNNEEEMENEKSEEEPAAEKEEKDEPEITPRRSGRALRQRTPTTYQYQNTDAEDERSEVETPKPVANDRGFRRVTRNRSVAEDDHEKSKDEEEDEDEPLGNRARRSLRQRPNESKSRDESSEPLMRRSSRRVVKSKGSSSEDEKDMQRSRPKRSRAPVDRFGYEAPEEPTPPPTTRRRRRRRNSEDCNIDQFSSEDEYVGGQGRRPKKYNMREKKRKSTSYRQRDTSSSSSSESADEQRFAKRKNKRMMVERSKLRPVNLSKHDATKAIFKERQSVGASMADIQPMEMDMGVTFESVGGVDDHVNSLREMVIFPLLYPEIFTKFCMTPPRGVLFYGPPGTGKTLIARALASECSRDGRKVAFFMRKGADCLSKWIGESERQLRLLFDQAYIMRPSIIFFDEIDGLAPVRSSRNDQIHSSIVSTLLALMDGLDNRGEIIVIGATNRIENIDPALRRPGRFDRELRFSLPTRESRKAILGLHTKKWNPPVDKDLVEILADKTIGYSGADLKGLCAEAALHTLRRKYPQVYKTSAKLALDFDQIRITEADFVEAMCRLVPSTHRIQDQSQSPLVPRLRPLLASVVGEICQKIDEVNKGHEFSYRPRILIRARPGQCVSTYIGPAILHHLEKLPCHKLDIPALFSNSARSPEEAMFHIIHEAKRTVPSVLYIPHLLRLWRNVLTPPQREAFMALLSEIQPTAPLIIIAFTEEHVADDDEDIIDDMFEADTEIVTIRNADPDQRRQYFQPIFDAASALPEEDAEDKPEEGQQRQEVLAILPIQESRELTEKEEKRLRRKEDTLLRELRIFLRETWQKINREQRFFMFRTAVDTDEIDDYLQYVEKPMDFDQMLTKLDNAEYHCAQDFLSDIDLIAENAINYNSDLNYETNKVICHRARALQDFAYALIKADMDTDFEDNCKEIIDRRKKLTETLKKPEEQTAYDPNTNQIVQIKTTLAALNSPTASTSTKKSPNRKRVRRSAWSSGIIRKPKAKPKPKEDEEDKEEKEDAKEGNEMEQDNAEDSDFDGEVSLNDTNNLKLDNTEDCDLEGEVTSDEIMELKMDLNKLRQIQDDLNIRTNESTTEVLEKVYTKLMECVSHYKGVYDRTQLLKDLDDKINNLLPQMSTTPVASRKKSSSTSQ